MATNRPHWQPDAPTLDLLECLFEYAGGYFRLRNFASATRRGYLSDQMLFVRYLKGTCGVSRVTEVERAHIVDYLSQAERSGLGGRTRARKRRRSDPSSATWKNRAAFRPVPSGAFPDPSRK